MIGTMLNGELKTIKPGGTVCGIGFTEIVLDYDDVLPKNREWLDKQILTRLCEEPFDHKTTVNYISACYCVKCDRQLSRHVILSSSGCCPYCGNIGGATVCDYKHDSLRVFKIAPWWKFWKKQFSCERVAK